MIGTRFRTLVLLFLFPLALSAQSEATIEIDPIQSKPGRQEVRELTRPHGEPMGPVIGIEIMPPFRIGGVRRLKLEPPDITGLKFTGADADKEAQVREVMRQPEAQLDYLAKGVADRGPLWIDAGAGQPVREGTYLLRWKIERIVWDGPSVPITPPLLITMMERMGTVNATLELVEPATGRVALRVSLERIFDRTLSRVSGALKQMFRDIGAMFGAILRALMEGDALHPAVAPAASAPAPIVTAPAAAAPSTPTATKQPPGK